MRQAAQRHMELQGCMPADIATMGYPLTLGSQQAINRAYEAWQARRGIKETTTWRQKPKAAPQAAPEVLTDPTPADPTPVKAAKAIKAIKVPRELTAKLSATDARERKLERQRAYRLANREKANELNREYQRRRRAAMTPEKRKTESAEVASYRKLATERRQASEKLNTVKGGK